MSTTPLPAGSLRATSLNAARRETELDAVAAERLDLLVVGAGLTGTGAALDAASRGLRVALVEAGDLAESDAGWPGPIGGGPRALEPAELVRARERAAERAVLLTRTAPHLVRTLPQLLPLREGTSRRTEAARTAAAHAEDALRRAARTPTALLPAPRRVPAVEAAALIPGLRTSGLRGGLLSYDARLVDDVRLVVALARTAAGFGARVLTRVRAVGLDRDGADAVDERTGEALRLSARAVVNATGARAGELAPEFRLRAVRESHLLVDAEAAGITGTALVPVDGGIALLPPGDEPHFPATAHLGPRTAPEAATGQSDVDELLAAVRTELGAPLGPEQLLGSAAALRPALDEPGGKLPDLSRAHLVRASPDGVVTVVGGDRVGYRRRAAEAVDTAVRAAGLPAGPSRTAAVPLVGAADRARLDQVEAPARLVARYGTEAARVAALAELDADLAEPVAEGTGLTAAEVLWAVRHEGALEPEDVLARRGGLGARRDLREAAAPAVTEIVDKALRGLLD
ncbi:FAD-dependent oxidoreductase [Saccharopolyspora sp. MS10]|uniref:FAD-dependent oxidoreductase n=1 Tax=Saccharopolyspora sp. MS10 TaxID=3385973 RepID=UPI0039A05F76